MMLKSMREAGSQDGLFDNEHSRTFTAMLDQQWSQHIAQRGLGLADMLTRQLLQSAPTQPPADAVPAALAADPAGTVAPAKVLTMVVTASIFRIELFPRSAT